MTVGADSLHLRHQNAGGTLDHYQVPLLVLVAVNVIATLVLLAVVVMKSTLSLGVVNMNEG